MAAHNELGKLGEEMAIRYLIKKGYEIKEKNWRFQKAEVDIIAQIENTLAVIEVKTRSTQHFGNPQDFVDSKNLPNNVSKSLQASIKQAPKLQSDNNPKNDGSVCDKLSEFIVHVNDKESSGKLDSSDADELEAASLRILAVLDCGM